MRRFKLTPWRIFLFGIGLALLIFLLITVDLDELYHLLTRIPWLWFLLGGLAYLAKSLLRTFRMVHINRLPIGAYGSMLRLWLASSLAAQLLPFKSGEVVYLFLLRRSHRIALPRGTSVVILMRLMDLGGLVFMFTLAVFFLGRRHAAAFEPFTRTALAAGIIVSLAFAVLMLASTPTAAFIHRLLDRPFLARRSFTPAIRAALDSFVDQLRGWTRWDIQLWFTLALLEWAANYLSFHSLLIGLGLQPTLLATVVCVTFAALAAVLPISTIGNFGTQEAGWATGLMLLGYTRQAAIASGFAAHLLTIAYMLIFGGPAWIWYLIAQRGPEEQR